MNRESARPVGKVFDEPWSAGLVATGVLVLQAGAGLQILWLLAAAGLSVVLGVRTYFVNEATTHAVRPDDRLD